MVLFDKAFSDMTFDQMNSVLEPEASGTRYLKKLFQEDALDFFRVKLSRRSLRQLL
jgi:hypothetical protein